MMNLSASTAPASADPATASEAGAAQAADKPSTALPGLEMVRARGRRVSDGDVAHFQAALSRAQSPGADGQPAPVAWGEPDASVLPSVDPKSGGQGSLDGTPAAAMEMPKAELPADGPVGADPQQAMQSGPKDPSEALAPTIVTGPSSARMRWLQRLQSQAPDKEDPEREASTPQVAGWQNPAVQPLADVAVVRLDVNRTASEPAAQSPPVQGRDLPVQSAPVAATEVSVQPAPQNAVDGSDLNPLLAQRERMALSGLGKARSDAQPAAALDASSGDAARLSELAAGNAPKPTAVLAGVSPEPAPVARDAAVVAQTVQDTVRGTLRTLAQRDLEALDLGRPVQVTLDQGELRGAQLTLQARDGLLEITVSAPQGRLRALLETQQDVLAQGLQRDVGAVRWLGLQEAQAVANEPAVQRPQGLNTGTAGMDADAQSFASRQNGQQSQDGSGRQPSPEQPEPEELAAIDRPRSETSRTVADAQALRQFLGL